VRRLLTIAAGLALTLGVAATRVEAASAPAPGPSLPNAPVCGASAADANQPTGGRSQPPVAPAYFPTDLPQFTDSDWGYPVGGIGGIARGGLLQHTPVVFVHGNQADAQNWLSVMQQFQNDAGYTLQEMFAISYNGLGNYYAGAPVSATPTDADQAYVNQNQAGLANGGHGAANDDEVPDLCRFVEEVQWYTGSTHVDIVAHSLGVTIVRKLMHDYPALAADVGAVVAVAGANHGTSVCRGIDTSYYGCNEIAPGSSWLDSLNGPGGSNETAGSTAWMTIYNGSAGDPFFDPPLDETSPMLKGADNRTFTGDYHNDLRVGVNEVDAYLPFLLRHGQVGPGANAAGPALAAQIENTHPNGLNGPALCVPRLTAPTCPAAVAAASVSSSSSAQAAHANPGSAATRGALPATGISEGPAWLAAALLLVGVLVRRVS
jgi:hypothetical protein